MSTSFDSYESLVYLMNCHYDKNLPSHYTDRHLDIVVSILQLMMSYNEFQCVVTRVPLQEPIVEYGSTIYISVPLVATLINFNVDLPKERITFTRNFNIFQGVKKPKKVKNSLQQCYQNYKNNDTRANDNDDNRASSAARTSAVEMTRIVQLLRLVMMCAHFYQHHKRRHTPPYLKHDDFDEIELAHITKQKYLKAKKPNTKPFASVSQREQYVAAVGSDFGSTILKNNINSTVSDSVFRRAKKRQR